MSAASPPSRRPIQEIRLRQDGCWESRYPNALTESLRTWAIISPVERERACARKDIDLQDVTDRPEAA